MLLRSIWHILWGFDTVSLTHPHINELTTLQQKQPAMQHHYKFTENKKINEKPHTAAGSQSSESLRCKISSCAHMI